MRAYTEGLGVLLHAAVKEFSQEGLGNAKKEGRGKESRQDEEGEEGLGDEARQEGLEEEGREEERESAQVAPEASSDFHYTAPSGPRSRAGPSGSAHATAAGGDSSPGSASRPTRDSNE